MSEANIDTVAAQRALDAFLVDNQELEQLSARLGEFNLFDVLRVSGMEIRHSNVLAWLLSPDESHGLGANFLRRFFSRLLMNHDEADVNISPAQVELMNFGDVEVLREWNNIDVLARSASGPWCLLIENKIHSHEAKGQLSRCLKRAQEDMPGYQIVPVYLTLDGDDPSEDGKQLGYVPLSHVEVLELAEQIVDQHRSRIPDDASIFINHYLSTLRRLTMQDSELIDLCKTIYRKHRVAIDLVVQYGTASGVVDAILTEIESLMDCEFANPTANSVWFLPKEMVSLLPEQELNGWAFLPRHTPIAFWCQYKKKTGKIGMVLEIGPISDGDMRVRLMTAVTDGGMKVGARAFDPKAKYTRIVSSWLKLKTNEDGEPDTSDDAVRAAVAKAWGKIAPEVEKLTKVLKEFGWK